MKVLLIRPNPPKETIGLQHVMICEPLELEYLVSNLAPDLKGKFDLKIIDMILEKKSYRDILMDEEPNFIVFTGYITHVGLIKELCKDAKAINPSILTGVGGVHAEVVPHDFESAYIDFIYHRNGIDGFNISLRGLTWGKSIDEIKNDMTMSGPKKTSFAYNFPDRQAVDRYRKDYYYMFHNPCALIKTSFGCPFNCSFCFCKEITDGKYFTRDVEDVLDELEGIDEEEIYIVDDDFLFNIDRINRFISLIKERNIEKQYLIYGRADFIANNEDLLKEFKKVGLQAVIVGIESVRSEDLKSYNKGTTKEINERCIKILKKLDIELYATLIIPMDFSKKDFKDLTGWLRDLDVRFVNLQPLTPLPGTDIFEDYIPHLIVEREDYSKWDMAHIVLEPEHMSIRAFYGQLLMAYYSVIMRPKHILALIRKYGIKANLKMLVGSSYVSRQYLKKIFTAGGL